MRVWLTTARVRDGHRGRSSFVATALRVDTLTDPIGLGDASPSLSWSFWSRRMAVGVGAADRVRDPRGLHAVAARPS